MHVYTLTEASKQSFRFSFTNYLMELSSTMDNSLAKRNREMRKTFRMRRQNDKSYRMKNYMKKSKLSEVPDQESWIQECLMTIWNREFMVGFASIGEIFLGLAIPFEMSAASNIGALYRHSLLHTVAGSFCVSMGIIGLGSLKYQLKTNGALLYGVFLIITALVLLGCILVNLTLFTHYDLSLPHGELQERLGGNYTAALYEHTMSQDHVIVNTVGPMLGLAMVLVAVLMAMIYTGTCFHRNIYQLVENMMVDESAMYTHRRGSYC